MTFYAVEIDACPAYGWQGGPSAEVLIRRLRNRHERRNKVGDLMQHTYTLPFLNVRSQEYFDEMKSAFMALGGPFDTFLANDWWDNVAENTSLGFAPIGTTPVQMGKTYTFGPASYFRPINKPMAGAVIRQNGIAKVGTYSQLTGLFIPTTDWTPGASLTADFHFRVQVRFAEFSMMPSIDSRSGGDFIMNGSCSLIEVFGE